VVTGTTNHNKKSNIRQLSAPSSRQNSPEIIMETINDTQTSPQIVRAPSDNQGRRIVGAASNTPMPNENISSQEQPRQSNQQLKTVDNDEFIEREKVEDQEAWKQWHDQELPSVFKRFSPETGTRPSNMVCKLYLSFIGI
jgi:hypothetical protein